jgi:diacylglycerol O-acyltransferase / wax synthase
MSNVLDLYDQTTFIGERATGTTNLLQCIWVYDRTIDIDGLRRFYQHLQRGRLSRRIEPSPLPFGRHRWVSASNQCTLEIVETPRPREEFDVWLAEQTNKVLDPERGPEWHLAVLPFTDGGAGVSLVISHCLTDGVGLCEALADAACGRNDPINWPAAGARPLWQALCADACQTARDIPAIGRAVVSAARFAQRNHASAGPATTPPVLSPRADEPIAFPKATIFVDSDEWDARASALGGTSNSLLAGFAARLAQRMGRVTADGSVDLTLPVNEREAGDTRANAITNVDFTVDPTPTTTDLRDIRAAIKGALVRSQEVLNERFELLPLAPLLPQWLVRRVVSVSAGSPTSVVSSNLGEVNPAAYRPDGTAADRFVMRSLGRGVTEAVMHRLGGLLVLLSGRTDREVFVSVLSYQPGSSNTNDALHQHLSSTLTDFSLTGTFSWWTDAVAAEPNSSELSELTA